MENTLHSVSRIFKERLYRIPDYQRGYAWTKKQLRDFWNDVNSLENDKNHYLGVLTLEAVPKSLSNQWCDDSWIIKNKSYEPFYVVDGQQRLTTVLIFIQAIIEIAEKKGIDELNYSELSEIRKQYIFESKDKGVSRSYIFGYEKDNPSYEFLKTRIFNEHSSSDRAEETIYTNNLNYAKQFFLENLAVFGESELEELFRRVTQNLLFNLYSISDDIDVFVTFETMNNRGKPLSSLELLKNRLIYISTKFRIEEDEKVALRKIINESWKSIYHYLGKNKENPLKDDEFLLMHFVIYFSDNYEAEGAEQLYMSRLWRSDEYSDYLLENYFNPRRINGCENVEDALTVEEVQRYAESLSLAVVNWFQINNPTFITGVNKKLCLILERLLRGDIENVAPLLLYYFMNSKATKTAEMEKFLIQLDRFLMVGHLSGSYQYWRSFEFLKYIKELKNGKLRFDDLSRHVEKRIEEITGKKEFIDNVIEIMKNRGFYKWNGIRYFLFEYELYLKKTAKVKTNKINWREFSEEKDDYLTVEHIYPQSAKSIDWPQFDKYSIRERRALLNSLGNLLPLSKPKNSSLKNMAFIKKVDNGKDYIGYRYGSFSEIEVSNETEWTAEAILYRGLKLLNFLEKNWNVDLGSDEKKKEILNLAFM